MGKDKKQKIRTDFRKNRNSRTRQRDFTRNFQADQFEDDVSVRTERVSGKGDLTRRRTVIGVQSDDAAAAIGVELEVDTSQCIVGRVLRVNGLISTVQSATGDRYQCATRRLLKTLSTDQRNVVVAGDRVFFRPADASDGIILRVEPRRGVLSRTSRGRQHVIATNVDQLLIVTSAAEPVLKPNLIDRILISAGQANIEPILCINKVDLVNSADLQPLAGVYGQMGYQVLLTSVTTGRGITELRRRMVDCHTAVAGQSGVGKSSLLNAVETNLGLRVGEVSRDTQKGKHTTTTAELIPLSQGGFVLDTPGIRQFQLWDVIPAEVINFFRDLRSYVHLCAFPDCTHTHELDCAIKDAVADGRVDARRYESYCQVFAGG